MTVIAYKNGILASDTKAVDTTGQVFKTHKLFPLSNGSVIGGAGDADIRDVLSLLQKASITKLPTRAKLVATKTEFSGIWVFPTGEVFTVEIKERSPDWMAEVFQVQESVAAVGSGAAYAMGAMMAGKSAIEAVKIACKLDNNCGLPVEHITLEKKTT